MHRAVFATPLLALACTPAPAPGGIPPSAPTDEIASMPIEDAEAPEPEPETDTKPKVVVHEPLPDEVHLANVRQITFGGENAEAYLSSDETQLVFQSTRDGGKCDQIYTMGIDGSEPKRVSSGEGRTTCAYFLPGDQRILYSSTHVAGKECPAPPDRSHGYVWKLYPEYDIYTAAADGSDVKPLASSAGYDAEATVSPKGDRIVFTSTRDGDPELYTMKIDGSDVRRLTRAKGYDGGAFFSPDGTRVVWRANYPKGKDELTKYEAILKDALVFPTRLEIFVMDATGRRKKQLTNNGKANFAPSWHPDGKRIVFASNAHDEKGRDFDLYIVGVDGKGLERVTWNDTFDGFPMFTKDGKKLVFASNRSAAKPGDTNIFVADWKE
jgi:Tol biopolymer transport system component